MITLVNKTIRAKTNFAKVAKAMQSVLENINFARSDQDGFSSSNHEVGRELRCPLVQPLAQKSSVYPSQMAI